MNQPQQQKRSLAALGLLVIAAGLGWYLWQGQETYSPRLVPPEGTTPVPREHGLWADTATPLSPVALTATQEAALLATSIPTIKGCIRWVDGLEVQPNWRGFAVICKGENIYFVNEQLAGEDIDKDGDRDWAEVTGPEIISVYFDEG